MWIALAGGTGSVKLVRGLARKLGSKLAVIGNVGDNWWHYGAYVCPDLDIIMYGLAGLLDTEKNWGIRNDTFNFASQLGALGYDSWFNLGDRDLAISMIRTQLIKEGATLSQVTKKLCENLNVKQTLLPVTNNPLETWIDTEKGLMHLQEFWVRDRGAPRVRGVSYKGSELAKPAPGVVEGITEAEGVILCPANPITSLGPILSVKGVKDALRLTSAKVIAVSPIIGSSPVSGPADSMLKALGLDVTPMAVAQMFRDFLDVFMLDSSDHEAQSTLEKAGISTMSADILMRRAEDEDRLASAILALK
jgi:LPPG:FO 2-phospho-L-lactate transferase